MQKIVPHLWFDKQANEAATFYMSLFEGSILKNRTILHDTPSGTAEMITMELAGQEFMLLSGGPYFKFTPAVSFLIACETVAEVERLWSKLIENGEVLMPLGTYPFSEKYGWVADQYGLSWQVMYMGDFDVKQKITPTFMFVGKQYGNAKEAVQLYTSLYKDSAIEETLRYDENVGPNKPGTIKRMAFTLNNQHFAAMDSAYEHDFSFTEAISFIVKCDTQEEIDYYWDKLSAVPAAEQCGWLKDQYGISWQIVPSMMDKMMNTNDPKKIAQVTKAFLKMKKFDIAELIKAFEQK